MFFYKEAPVSPTPSIITDGLLFNLDAGNPASYPGTGSTWYDLSGLNNHATLINSPTFNNSGLLSSFSTTTSTSIYDDANTSYAQIPDIPTRINSVNFTCESVFYFTNTNKLSTAIWKRHPSKFTQFNYGIGADAQNGGRGKNLNFFLQPESLSFLAGVRKLDYSLTIGGGARIVHATLVNDSTSARLYLNGILVASDSTPQIGGTFNIAGHPTTVGRDMQIYLARLYNKALTQQEVTQNFNTIKNRYGL